MADLTGHIIKDRFAPFRRVENSFYETMPLDSGISKNEIILNEESKESKEK